MELVTVGTGTVAPSGSRTSACHWVGRGNLKILFDCGAGALHRLAQFGLPWHQITHVVLSHFHPDHWGELPMLVYALKYTAVPARQEPFVILGPPGVVRLLKKLAEGYGPWLLDPGFPIGILDVQASEPFPLESTWRTPQISVPTRIGRTSLLSETSTGAWDRSASPASGRGVPPSSMRRIRTAHSPKLSRSSSTAACVISTGSRSGASRSERLVTSARRRRTFAPADPSSSVRAGR